MVWFIIFLSCLTLIYPGVFLCYDVHDPLSLPLLQTWADLLSSTHSGLFGAVIAINYDSSSSPSMTSTRVISSTEGLDFANYNNLKYFELNPWESSMEEISGPFDWMASLCVRKMTSFTSYSIPIYQKKFIFHGYHSGWWFDVHRFYHPSFRSFVFLVMLSCARGKNKKQLFNPSILPLEVILFFPPFFIFNSFLRSGFVSFPIAIVLSGNHLRTQAPHRSSLFTLSRDPNWNNHPTCRAPSRNLSLS
jgi:hypothetical protein